MVRVRVDIRAEPLSVDEAMASVRDLRAGGICLFVGTVRDHDPDHPGRSVTGLDYEAHPSAVESLRTVAEEVAERHPIVALAAVHRTGRLNPTDLAVVVAVSAAHRAEAFEACRDLIDTLKASVPIWKRQSFADGVASWVGTP